MSWLVVTIGAFEGVTTTPFQQDQEPAAIQAFHEARGGDHPAAVAHLFQGEPGAWKLLRSYINSDAAP